MARLRYLLLFMALMACGTALSAQQLAEAKEGCFRGRPLPECSSFWLFELGGQLPLVRSVRVLEVGGGGGPSFLVDEPYHQWSFGWDVGLAFNVTDTDALGATVGVEVPDTRYFLRGRYRRWLTEQGSVEFVPGVFRDQNDFFEGGFSLGTTFGVRYNISDRGHVLVRYDALFTESREPVFPGGVANPGGTGHALYLGAGLGSSPAMWGTGVLAVGFLAAFAVYAAAESGR